VVVENYRLELHETFNDLLELGKKRVPHDSRHVARFRLLSPYGEQLRQDQKVEAAKLHDGDTLTFVMMSRDPRAEDWVSRVRADPDMLLRAPEYARSDPVVIMEAVKLHRGMLCYAVPELRGDREIVSMAVSTDGGSLRYASQELRDDKDVVLNAVLNHPFALQFASERLRGDFELVLCACTNHGNSLEFASPELQQNEKIVLAAIETPGPHLQEFPPTLQELRHRRRKSNRPVLPIQFAAESLRSNFEFMWQAIQRDTRCLRYAAEQIRGPLKEKMKEKQLEERRFKKDDEIAAEMEPWPGVGCSIS